MTHLAAAWFAPQGTMQVVRVRDHVINDAGACFGQLVPRATSATKPLLGLLKDEDPGVRREAMYALRKIGSFAGEHVPLLISLLKDQTWELRSSAAEALGKVGPQAKAAVESLRETLRDPEPQVRWWSADALSKIGPDARGAIPDLDIALKDGEELVRMLAEEAAEEDPTTLSGNGRRPVRPVVAVTESNHIPSV